MGYSSHAYVVAEAAMECGFKITGYANIRQVENDPFKLEYLGIESDIDFMGWDNEYGFILGVGDNKIRKKIAELVIQKGEDLKTVIHPSSLISQTSNIGIGTFISKGVMVNAFAIIGKGVILNTGCIVEHECKVGNYTHIAPGAVLAGNVSIGRGSFIGSNTVIKENTKIGNDVIVGAGSVIINDIPDGKKVVGNPGREI